MLGYKNRLPSLGLKVFMDLDTTVSISQFHSYTLLLMYCILILFHTLIVLIYLILFIYQFLVNIINVFTLCLIKEPFKEYYLLIYLEYLFIYLID